MLDDDLAGKNDAELERLYKELKDLYAKLDREHKELTSVYHAGGLGAFAPFKSKQEEVDVTYEICKYYMNLIDKEMNRRKRKKNPFGYYLGKLFKK